MERLVDFLKNSGWMPIKANHISNHTDLYMVNDVTQPADSLFFPVLAATNRGDCGFSHFSLSVNSARF
jgi:hypothetical protein